MALVRLLDSETKKFILLALPNFIGLLLCIYLLWSTNELLIVNMASLNDMLQTCLVFEAQEEP